MAPVDPADGLNRGLEVFRSGDYVEATQAWGRARRAGAGVGVARALAEAYFRLALAFPVDRGQRRVQVLHEAVALAPDQARYHLHLGLAYHRQGNLRRAAAVYAAALRPAPDAEPVGQPWARAGTGGAQGLTRRQEERDALSRLRHHLALALLADPATAAQARAVLDEWSPPNEAQARLRALVHLGQGEATAAAALLAAQRDPSPQAALAVGLARLAAGQPGDALAPLEAARRSRRLADEARQAAAIAGAMARARTGDLAGALKALLTHDLPADERLRRGLAAACRAVAQELLLDERPDEALRAWQHALDAEPGHEPTRCALAHVHEVLATRAARRDDLALAARHREAALALQPDHPRTLRNLALAEERLERWTQAATRWEALVRRWKKELRDVRRADEATAAELRRRLAVAYRQLATTYDAADDVPAATRTLEQALAFDPSQDDLRLRAAELYLEDEDPASAIPHLRHALASRPDDSRILVDLGLAYDLKGDDLQAQTHLERALAREPENRAVQATLAGVHHGRGHRLEKSGRSDAAVLEFERAVTLDAGDVRARLDLAWAYTYGRGDYTRAATMVAEGEAVASARDDRASLAEAQTARATLAAFQAGAAAARPRAGRDPWR